MVIVVVLLAADAAVKKEVVVPVNGTNYGSNDDIYFVLVFLNAG
jgi:hypothetical protein